MDEVVIATRGLRKAYGALVVTRDLDFDVRRGEVHAVIGPNGAGKSSLLAQLAGELASDAGSITICGHDVTALGPEARAHLGLARSFQVTTLIDEFTAEENVALAVLARAGRTANIWRSVRKDTALAEEACGYLKLTGLLNAAARRVCDLAHGDRRVLEIAVALAKRPSILLLDEPMAGMGHDEGRALTKLLGVIRRDVTIVLIEHDMEAVEKLADRVSVLVGGALIASGSFGMIRNDAQVRVAYLGERA